MSDTALQYFSSVCPAIGCFVIELVSTYFPSHALSGLIPLLLVLMQSMVLWLSVATTESSLSLCLGGVLSSAQDHKRDRPSGFVFTSLCGEQC